jgi:hypothetical protein
VTSLVGKRDIEKKVKGYTEEEKYWETYQKQNKIKKQNTPPKITLKNP